MYFAGYLHIYFKDQSNERGNFAVRFLSVIFTCSSFKSRSHKSESWNTWFIFQILFNVHLAINFSTTRWRCFSFIEGQMSSCVSGVGSFLSFSYTSFIWSILNPSIRLLFLENTCSDSLLHFIITPQCLLSRNCYCAPIVTPWCHQSLSLTNVWMHNQFIVILSLV